MRDDGGQAQRGLSEQVRSLVTAESMDRAPTLVLSKLGTPPPRVRSIRRLRVERMLAEAVTGQLILVAAPAGYGKTTLVATWAASSRTRVAWVTLGQDDNVPARFWAYVLAALARAGVDVGPADGADYRLETLSNVLAELSSDVVLALDDFQWIASAEIHRDLAALIEQRLPRFHLMLLTRSDPPLVK